VGDDEFFQDFRNDALARMEPRRISAGPQSAGGGANPTSPSSHQP
jgi:hypothetical protein